MADKGQVWDSVVARHGLQRRSLESLASALTDRAGRVRTHLARVAPFDRKPFVALNVALFADGAWIELPAGAVMTQPIHLLFLSTGQPDGRPMMAHPHVVMNFGENGQACVAGGASARPAPNARSICRATTIRWTSSGPS